MAFKEYFAKLGSIALSSPVKYKMKDSEPFIIRIVIMSLKFSMKYTTSGSSFTSIKYATILDKEMFCKESWMKAERMEGISYF